MSDPEFLTTKIKNVKFGKRVKIIKPCNLYDCIDLYLEKELIESHKINNETKSVYKQIKIYRFPKIFIFTLNRFDNNNNKIDEFIDFPLELDMKKYSNKKSNMRYELYSICNHYGGSGGGHYTSVCKNNNNWYEFNDNSVRKINNINKNNAYCLFYRKTRK